MPQVADTISPWSSEVREALSGRLLKRVFDIDIEHCPHCGGRLKVIAAIKRSLGDCQDPHAP
jgi:hypothetical protein